MYFKNDKMKLIDEEIGDLHSNIIAEELKIVQDLRTLIGQNMSTIEDCAEFLSIIDA